MTINQELESVANNFHETLEPIIEQPGHLAPAAKKIFNRFYRVNSDRSRHTGGSGLGLSIAQAIAQAHQGTIQVESQLGQGSIFTIILPIQEQ